MFVRAAVVPLLGGARGGFGDTQRARSSGKPLINRSAVLRSGASTAMYPNTPGRRPVLQLLGSRVPGRVPGGLCESFARAPMPLPLLAEILQGNARLIQARLAQFFRGSQDDCRFAHTGK